MCDAFIVVQFRLNMLDGLTRSVCLAASTAGYAESESQNWEAAASCKRKVLQLAIHFLRGSHVGQLYINVAP